MCRIKKMISALTASALSLTMFSTIPSAIAVGETAKVVFSSECENLELADGATVATKVYNDEYPGFTGDGFVWVTSGGTMSFTVDAPETGMYRLVSRSLMYLGNEGEIREGSVSVERADGTSWSKTVKIPRTSDWNDYSFGDIKLTKGENTITFGGGWGYCLYDSVTLTQTPPPDYSKATDTLVDSKATDEAKALMKYLKSVYGSHIISGQQEIYGGGNDGNSELEFEYIDEVTGKQPAIRGFDFMNYNPLYGWEDGTTERAIAWAKEKNGIVTASWHINVPIDFDNYEIGDAVDWKQCTYKNYQASNSTFNTANILVEDSKERAYFEEAMKDLAEQLLKLQEAGVPIIFRPLHEAQGNEGNFGDGTSWFWWGDRGSEVYKELWKLLYNTLTETYGLHNIIWEYNSYNYSNSHTWYPGDEYVDIVAYDKYNVDYNRDDGLTSGPNLSAISAIYNYLVELTDGKKMVAMAENDTIPSVDNLTVENAGWLYFCPWYGEHLMSERYQDADNLKEIYNSDYCITLDELPADLYKLSDTDPTEPTKPSESTGSDVLYGDATLDGNVDIADAVAVASYVGDGAKNTLSAEALKNADVQAVGDGVTANDALAIQQYLANVVKELPV
ncbi:MAG: glycosyl hydrolase [Oscillospiraceae bacterium]|nr:glycosyl hydrolase [Oscillospiraceae bacterium]